MVKKIAASVLALTMIFGTGVLTAVNVIPDTAITASAADEHVYKDYKYIYVNNTAEITAYTGTAENVVIPSKIEGGVYDGAKIVGINAHVFEDNKTIKSVTIPEGVEYIDSCAFMNCTALNSVKLPKSLKSISSSVFKNCTSLKTISLPPKLESLGFSSFAYSGLTSITIPNSVQDLCFHAFQGCKDLTSASIGEGVTKAEFGIFADCTNLKTVKLPSKMTELPTEMFQNCKSLKSIDIPASVTEIYYDAFIGCTSLTSINIPVGVTKVERGAFFDCTNLKSITLPTTLTFIGDSAFGYTNNSPDNKVSGFKLLCYKGTFGEQYAIDNHINYELIKPANYPGNVNGDDKIDVSDLSVLANHINGIKPLTDAQFKRADVNGDGKVDVQDAASIANHINGVKTLY